MMAGTSGRWYEAELHRLRGDLLVREGASSAAAEVCYETAIAVAGRQGARLWQLRASNALAGYGVPRAGRLGSASCEL
jgi:predicted ATPase